MLDKAAFEKILLDASHSVRVAGVGRFEPCYRSAVYANDKASIKPPHFGWMLYAEDATEQYQLLIVVPSLLEEFREGLKLGQSFEIPGLGLFLRGTLAYDFIPAHAMLQQCQEHYGLTSLSLKQATNVKELHPAPSQQMGRKVNRSNKWLLQTAAVLAFLLVANFLVLQVVVKEGSLFTLNQTSLGSFDSLKQLPDELDILEPVAEEFAEESIDFDTMNSSPETSVSDITDVANPTNNSIVSTNEQIEITVVVGAFASKQNADKFLARLIEDGFEAKNLGSAKRGLTRIGLVSKGNQRDNASFLRQVREQISTDAWVLE